MANNKTPYKVTINNKLWLSILIFSYCLSSTINRLALDKKCRLVNCLNKSLCLIITAKPRANDSLTNALDQTLRHIASFQYEDSRNQNPIVENNRESPEIVENITRRRIAARGHRHPI